MAPGLPKEADEHRFSCVELWEGLVVCRRGLAKASVAWHGVKRNAKLLLRAVPKFVNAMSGPERISGQTNGMNLLQAHGCGVKSRFRWNGIQSKLL